MQIVNGKLVHGYKVENGGTYCTDCGARLEVGGYQTHLHTDKVTRGRGVCPNQKMEK